MGGALFRRSAHVRVLVGHRYNRRALSFLIIFPFLTFALQPPTPPPLCPPETLLCSTEVLLPICNKKQSQQHKLDRSSRVLYYVCEQGYQGMKVTLLCFALLCLFYCTDFSEESHRKDHVGHREHLETSYFSGHLFFPAYSSLNSPQPLA